MHEEFSDDIDDRVLIDIRTATPVEFFKYAQDNADKWEQLRDRKVLHREGGIGTIDDFVKVRFDGKNTCERIYIKFNRSGPEYERVYTPSDFAEGIFTEFILSTKEITNYIRETLRSLDLKKAEKLCEKYKEILKDSSFNYPSVAEPSLKVCSFLREYRFAEADEFFNKHKANFDSTSYNQLRQEALCDKAIKEIRKQMHSDYLGADSFFLNSYSDMISESDYEEEKKSFVKSWISKNTSSSKKGEKYLPDEAQISAIAAVHGHVQVVARAGSGKTMTLVNRALFLIKNCGVLPAEMLLLAFNRKAAMEIRRRLLESLGNGADELIANGIKIGVRESDGKNKVKREEIEANVIDDVAMQLNVQLPHVMTFHALAYAIVHPEEQLLYNDSEGENQTLNRVIQQVIDDHLQIPNFKNKIRELMLAHFREDWDRIVMGCKDRSKEELVAFRRSLPRETLRGDYVKSFGEKVIANFLFEHDIVYKYERNHWWSGINYRPDFTIFKTPKSGVIIEYFGLQGDTDYDEMSEKKRAYWKSKQDWNLVEFSPRNIVVDGIDSFLQLLKESLESQGVSCIRLSEEEIWHRVRERAVDRFTKATVGFIGRCRKQSLTPSGLRDLIDSYTPLSSTEALFLKLVHSFYIAYLERLSTTGEEDFDGLMQRATDAICSGQTMFKRKSGRGNLALLRYVCIDEFQDFSDLFYRLLNAVRKQNPKMELFCVGDDWQAINGFAGSDLRFFENFTELIGKGSKLYISTNYRSSKTIVAVGNALMHGLGQPAISQKKTDGIVRVLDLKEFEPSLLEKQRHPGDIITPAVLRLINKAQADGLDVVMLSRRNDLPWFVNYRDQSDVGGVGLARYLDLVRAFFPKGLRERITISTAHRYKGLEKQMVIILDAVERSYPLIHPDWAFFRILGDSPEKIEKEERRLLYVALTRAVEKLVIITDDQNKSPFLKDIERIQRLCAIDWTDYPPIPGKTTRLIVKIGNQEEKSVKNQQGGCDSPTYVIKDLLKAAGYQYQKIDWLCWEKSFPAEGFSIEFIKAELWAGQADGIEVRIFNDTDVKVACYMVNAGQWNTVNDNLSQMQTPHP